MQLLCFAVNLAPFNGDVRFGGSNHSKKKFSLFSFFYTPPNDVAEVFLRHTFVGFTVVRAHAGAAADELINQPVVGGIPRKLSREPDDRLAKLRCPLLEVERMFVTSVWTSRVIEDTGYRRNIRV